MMSLQLNKLVLLSVLIHCVCRLVDAFVLQPNGRTALVGGPTSSKFVLNMVENEAPKRRRKRKITSDDTSSEEESSEASSSQPYVASVPTIELKPRDDNPVQMQILDVRDVVGGGGPRPSPSSASSKPSERVISLSESSFEQSSAIPKPVSSSRNVDDSLQQLLEDAKMMQDKEPSSSESEGNMKATIRNALGTLVTADFFVVCGFLLWFLVGIFCSSVLKDDTIQIAFNSNFQAFVQPALGILMIGSVAGNFFQEEGEED